MQSSVNQKIIGITSICYFDAMLQNLEQKRIGLIGGLSWESTATYYAYFNELAPKKNGWSQPRLLINSLDFGEIVPLQQHHNWIS